MFTTTIYYSDFDFSWSINSATSGKKILTFFGAFNLQLCNAYVVVQFCHWYNWVFSFVLYSVSYITVIIYQKKGKYQG